MKIHWGAVPTAGDFHPEEDGWSPIREPSPGIMQFIAAPLGMIVTALLAVLLHHIAPHGLCGSGSATFQGRDADLLFIGMLTALVLFIPVHEMIHALVHTARGCTDQTLLGIWPSRLLFYAHYDGVLTRNRFLAILAAPMLVLSLGPIPLIVLMDAWGRWKAAEIILTALSLINLLSSAGDLLGILLVAWQIPTDALVRNRGWRTYWKRPAADAR